MNFLFPKTGHKHSSSVHLREPEVPIGKEMQAIDYRAQRAVAGDFGESHVDVVRDRCNGDDGGEGYAHISSLQQAAYQANEGKLQQRDSNDLKIPNLAHKTSGDPHNLNRSKVVVTERHPHSKTTSAPSSHSKIPSTRFQFSWWSPFAAIYRTAKRISHFFAGSTQSASSSLTLRKTTAATFSSLPQRKDFRKETPLSDKDDKEKRRLQFLDDWGNKQDAPEFYRLSKDHDKELQKHLKKNASHEGLSFTLEEYEAQMKERAEKGIEVMKELTRGIYSNLKPKQSQVSEDDQPKEAASEN